MLGLIVAAGLDSATTTGRSAGILESTDDAYVKADYTIDRAEGLRLHRRGAGRATTQPVKAGQVLARIDDRDFRTALGQAEADVAAAEAAIRNLDAQIALQQLGHRAGHGRRRRGRSQR